MNRPIAIYVTYYYITEDVATRSRCHVFHGDYADIPFDSIGAATTRDSPGADGTVRLRLADAKVLRVSGAPAGRRRRSQATPAQPRTEKSRCRVKRCLSRLGKDTYPRRARGIAQGTARAGSGKRATPPSTRPPSSAPAGHLAISAAIRDKAQLEATRKRARRGVKPTPRPP